MKTFEELELSDLVVVKVAPRSEMIDGKVVQLDEGRYSVLTKGGYLEATTVLDGNERVATTNSVADSMGFELVGVPVYKKNEKGLREMTVEFFDGVDADEATIKAPASAKRTGKAKAPKAPKGEDKANETETATA